MGWLNYNFLSASIGVVGFNGPESTLHADLRRENAYQREFNQDERGCTNLEWEHILL